MLRTSLSHLQRANNGLRVSLATDIGGLYFDETKSGSAKIGHRLFPDYVDKKASIEKMKLMSASGIADMRCAQALLDELVLVLYCDGGYTR